MIAPAFAIVLGFLAADPGLDVRWTNSKLQSVLISVTDESEQIASCVRNGFEQRYKFTLQLCRRRQAWLSDCTSEHVYTYALRRDPLTDEFNLTSDIIGDKLEPSSVAFQTFSEAQSAISNLRGVTIESLGLPADKRDSEKHYFLGVRLSSSCKGDYNETLAKISYILSLGLLRFQDRSTGWKYFDLW